MAGRAAALESVLRESAVKVTRIALDDEHDLIMALEKALLDLAASRDGEDIALNVTGGTKLMALAAQSVAQLAGWRVFYVHVDTDEVIWLGQGTQRKKLGGATASAALPQSLRIPSEQGIQRPPADRRHNDLLQTMISQRRQPRSAARRNEFLAQEAEAKELLNIELSRSTRAAEVWKPCRAISRRPAYSRLTAIRYVLPPSRIATSPRAAGWSTTFHPNPQRPTQRAWRARQSRHPGGR